MTYYNTLVADKLKTISEIQRTNNLIDAHKVAGKDVSNLLETLGTLKADLELLNAEILGIQLSANDQSAANSWVSPPEDLSDSEIAQSPADLSDINPDDPNTAPSGGLSE